MHERRLLSGSIARMLLVLHADGLGVARAVWLLLLLLVVFENSHLCHFSFGCVSFCQSLLHHILFPTRLSLPDSHYQRPKVLQHAQ